MAQFPGGYPAITAENLDGSEKILIDDAGTKSISVEELGDYLGTGGGGGGGASDLADLGDVEIGTPTDGQVLVYDDASGKWVPGTGASGVTTEEMNTAIGTATADFRTETEINALIAAAAGSYAGNAAPADNPGTPAGPEFYTTAQAGTYTNFGGLVVSAGSFAILSYDGSTWTKSEVALPGGGGSVQTVYGTVDALTGYSSAGDPTGNRTFINVLLPNANPGTVKQIQFRGSNTGAIKIKFFKRLSTSPLIFREIKNINVNATAATTTTLIAGVDFDEFAVDADTYIGAWWAAAAGAIYYKTKTAGYSLVTGDPTTMGDAIFSAASNRELALNFTVETDLAASLGQKVNDLIYEQSEDPVVIDEDKLTTAGFDIDFEDPANYENIEINPAATVVEDFYIGGSSLPAAATGAAYIKLPYTPGQIVRISGMRRKDDASTAAYITGVQFWNASDVRVGSGVNYTGAIGDFNPADIVTYSTGVVTQVVITLRRGTQEGEFWYDSWDMGKFKISIDGVDAIQYQGRQVVTEINGKQLHADLQNQDHFLTALERIENLEKQQHTRFYNASIVDSTEQRPRIDQAAPIRLLNGELMIVHNYFDGAVGDSSVTDLQVRKSYDDGFTWVEGVIISRDIYRGIQACSLYQQAGGKIILMVLVKTETSDGDKSFVAKLTSTDDGETWSSITAITEDDDTRYLVTANDRIYKIPAGDVNAGRLLLPYSELRYDLIPTYAEPKSGRYIYSDDDGETWTEHATQLTDTGSSTRYLSEPGFFSKPDGTLVYYGRASGNIRAWDSTDGGATWGSMYLSIASPSSQSAIKYIERIGKYVAVTNDVLDTGTQFQNRKHMIYWLSDDGATWTKQPTSLNIWDGVRSVLEPSIHNDERLGGLLIFYSNYDGTGYFNLLRVFVSYYDLLSGI